MDIVPYGADRNCYTIHAKKNLHVTEVAGAERVYESPPVIPGKGVRLRHYRPVARQQRQGNHAETKRDGLCQPQILRQLYVTIFRNRIQTGIRRNDIVNN
jgi:hypothetical protein